MGAASDFGKVDGGNRPPASRNHSEFIILFRVFQSQGTASDKHHIAFTVCHVKFDLRSLADGLQNDSEISYVLLVFKGIAVTILIVNGIIRRSEKGLHIFKIGKIHTKQLHTGVEGNGLQPPLLKGRQRYCGLVFQWGGHIGMHQLPLFAFEGGHNGQHTLAKCVIRYDLLQFLFGVLTVEDSGKNGGNRIVIGRVKLTEYHSPTSCLIPYIRYMASRSFLN